MISRMPLFLVAALVMSVGPGAGAETAGDLEFVIATLRKIQPPTYKDTQAEEALAAKGKGILPALAKAGALGAKLVGDDELTTNRYRMPRGGWSHDGRPREQRVADLARRRTAVLDRVTVRLGWGFNPPDVLAKWAAARKAIPANARRLPQPPQRVAGAALGKVMPDLLWYSMIIRMYPVGRMYPGWPTRNLFAIDRKGKVTQISTAKALEGFFGDKLPGVTDEQGAKLSVRAWLELAEVFNNDGFFRFTIAEASVKARNRGGGDGWTAAGRTEVGQPKPQRPVRPGPVVARMGNRGFIDAALEFDATGRLAKVTQEVKLRAGMRPICQSTKLLDADPIVRRMAETELRIMGRAAEQYLTERRAKASPKLRAAIDRIWQQVLDDERTFGP